MSFFDSITAPVASAAGAALSFIGGQKTNQANIDIANANNQWSAEQYATRYQTQVKDLEAAGLNPMLAYMQSPGSAPQAQPVTLTNPYHSAVQTFNESYGTRGRYESDIASAEQSRKMAVQIDSSTDKIKQEIVNLQSDNDRIKQLLLNLEEERQNLIKEGFNKTETGNVLRETVKKLRAEVPWLQSQTYVNAMRERLLKLDVEAGESLGNIGREYGQLKPIVDLLVRLFGR